MKRMSDYTGEEAFDLWADIYEPVRAISDDKEVKKYTSGKDIDIQEAANVILKKHRKEAFKIMNRIDPDINGANILTGLIIFVAEMTTGESSRTFFKSAGREKSDIESSGSATENTEDGVK